MNVDCRIGAVAGSRNGWDFIVRLHLCSKHNGVLRVRIDVRRANEAENGENAQFSHGSLTKGIWVVWGGGSDPKCIYPMNRCKQKIRKRSISIYENYRSRINVKPNRF